MSLKVWLPLNGNLNNYGLSNLTFKILNTGININDNGKIGKAYERIADSTGAIISNEKIYLGTKVSMCAWVNPSVFSSNDNLTGILGQHRFQSNCGMGLTFRYVSSSTGYLSLNTGNGTSRTFASYYGTTLLSANNWYHIAFTYDEEKIRLYVNGNLDKEVTYLNQLNIEDYILLFGWSLTGTQDVYSNYKLTGRLNDVRIYDEVLSSKQIKEIAKGLVCHYKMDSFSNKNLIYNIRSGGHTTKVDNHTIVTDGENGDTYYFLDPYTTLTSGSTYTLRIYASGLPKGVVWNWSVGNSNNPITSLNIVNGLNEISFTCSSNYSNITMDDGSRPSGYNYPVTFSNFELFESNNGYIKDYSGYNNNGNIIESVKIKTESPKYNKSIQMSGTSHNRFYVSDFYLGNISTISCWIHPENITSTTQWIYHLGNGSGTASDIQHGLYINSSSIVWDVGAQGTYSYTLQNNQWYFLTTTTDGSTSKLYFNGELVKTLTPTYVQKTVLTLCNRSGNSTGTTSGTYPFKGSISDFRVYATALSADDIRQLYQTSAWIDNQQNAYAYELQENNNSKINKNGIIETENFQEYQLPSEYQEVEYIESTGTQYLELPRGFSPSDYIYAKMSIDSSMSSGDKHLVSTKTWDTTSRFAFGLLAGKFCYGYGNLGTSNTNFSPSTSNDGNIHEWYYNNGKFSISDLNLNAPVSNSFGVTETTNITLFYNGYSGVVKGKIYKFIQCKANNFYINLIPCYNKSSNAIGMYDTINNVFYENTGTGTFIKGKDINYKTKIYQDEIATGNFIEI